MLKEYAAMPGQLYPLNVRIPFVPNLECSLVATPMPTDLSFLNRHNVYQRVKKIKHQK